MNYQPRGISDLAIQGPASYLSELGAAKALLETQPTWNGVTAEAVARMRLQNRFKTGLDIARYTASLMRSDMAAYDADPTKYTQSLGCWHGFIAQQKLISVKKHFGKTDRRYLYLSGWMIAALRSEFGPLPDQSMHEKTSVPKLIRPSRKSRVIMSTAEPASSTATIPRMSRLRRLSDTNHRRIVSRAQIRGTLRTFLQ